MPLIACSASVQSRSLAASARRARSDRQHTLRSDRRFRCERRLRPWRRSVPLCAKRTSQAATVVGRGRTATSTNYARIVGRADSGTDSSAPLASPAACGSASVSGAMLPPGERLLERSREQPRTNPKIGVRFGASAVPVLGRTWNGSAGRAGRCMTSQPRRGTRRAFVVVSIEVTAREGSFGGSSAGGPVV